jgi:hypothetical protein
MGMNKTTAVIFVNSIVHLYSAVFPHKHFRQRSNILVSPAQ